LNKNDESWQKNIAENGRGEYILKYKRREKGAAEIFFVFGELRNPL
jgi:hypothetical protein